jgi:glycosyltransferase involved in cell wall biosynthesis
MTSLFRTTDRIARISPLFGFREVYDHPLSYLNNTELDRLKSSAFIRSKISNASSGIVKLGVFGFISFYKGILTAVEALRYLPSNFRLIIHGSIHPAVGLDHQECDDIGNYVQLAQTVQAIASEFVASGVNGKLKPLESLRYTAETLRDLYCKIILGAPQSHGNH